MKSKLVKGRSEEAGLGQKPSLVFEVQSHLPRRHSQQGRHPVSPQREGGETMGACAINSLMDQGAWDGLPAYSFVKKQPVFCALLWIHLLPLLLSHVAGVQHLP